MGTPEHCREGAVLIAESLERLESHPSLHDGTLVVLIALERGGRPWATQDAGLVGRLVQRGVREFACVGASADDAEDALDSALESSGLIGVCTTSHPNPLELHDYIEAVRSVGHISRVAVVGTAGTDFGTGVLHCVQSALGCP